MLQQVVREGVNTWRLSPALPRGDYFFRFGVMCDSRFYTHNSDKIGLMVQ
jgi:hypothetical protein